nr:YutD-like domain-containing protein [Cohnella algarum]
MTEGSAYTIVHDHKNGWNPEAFRARYSEVLDRYDYVVGDWGYNQLRLKGFFREPNPKGPKDSVISNLADYLNEYCNFGCAFFVLEKTDPKSVPESLVTDLTAAAEQAAESSEGDDDSQAAASAQGNGLILRWPLKDRPIGRVPGTSPSAVARAVSEGAERRAAAQAQAAGGSSPAVGGRSEASRKPGQDGGGQAGSGRTFSRPSDASGGRNGDRRPQQAGGPRGGGSSSAEQGKRSGGPHHKPPQHHNGGGSKEPRERSGANGHDGSVQAEAAHGSQSRSGGRWSGKNRRRGSGFNNGGKPNRPRHDGGAPRPEGGRRPPELGNPSGGER